MDCRWRFALIAALLVSFQQQQHTAWVEAAEYSDFSVFSELHRETTFSEMENLFTTNVEEDSTVSPEVSSTKRSSHKAPPVAVPLAQTKRIRVAAILALLVASSVIFLKFYGAPTAEEANAIKRSIANGVGYATSIDEALQRLSRAATHVEQNLEFSLPEDVVACLTANLAGVEAEKNAILQVEEKISQGLVSKWTAERSLAQALGNLKRIEDRTLLVVNQITGSASTKMAEKLDETDTEVQAYLPLQDAVSAAGRSAKMPYARLELYLLKQFGDVVELDMARMRDAHKLCCRGERAPVTGAGDAADFLKDVAIHTKRVASSAKRIRTLQMIRTAGAEQLLRGEQKLRCLQAKQLYGSLKPLVFRVGHKYEVAKKMLEQSDPKRLGIFRQQLEEVSEDVKALYQKVASMEDATETHTSLLLLDHVKKTQASVGVRLINLESALDGIVLQQDISAYQSSAYEDVLLMSEEYAVKCFEEFNQLEELANDVKGELEARKQTTSTPEEDNSAKLVRLYEYSAKAALVAFHEAKRDALGISASIKNASTLQGIFGLYKQQQELLLEAERAASEAMKNAAAAISCHLLEKAIEDAYNTAVESMVYTSEQLQREPLKEPEEGSHMENTLTHLLNTSSLSDMFYRSVDLVWVARHLQVMAEEGPIDLALSQALELFTRPESSDEEYNDQQEN